ncbi:MAG: leucyl aminopeptidase [Acidobacteria bacterium]|nr:leucyl aminopeptidase [Acidobacteriota bacterium]
MQIEHQSGEYRNVACDMLIFPVFEDETAGSPALRSLDKAAGGMVHSALASKEFKPELYNRWRLHNPGGLRARSLLLVGAGKKTDFTPARLREIAGTGVRTARSSFSGSVVFLCRGIQSPSLAARVAAEGALYANYESDLYKTRDRDEKDVKKFRILIDRKAAGREIEEDIRRGIEIGEATNFARTLANEPANILTPSRFAERALEEGSRAGLALRVMERDEMEKLGMNALLAVSRGSDEPPKMLVVETPAAAGNGRKRKPAYGLIGKGVTFDSGGISLKPSEKMEDMKADMAGGAAVLGAMVALARLGTRMPIVGLIPLVENMPGGRATKPGDVVRSFLGKTIEIINTDAEGRLIMADALYYARKMGARRILDIATLTGACVVALGHVNAGMMGTDRKAIDQLRKNCDTTGEGLWQLPICDAYRREIRSEIADMKNVGNRWAGAITAAKFLQEFTEDVPWVHLDIAGMDLDHDGRPFACKGATGFGVRTIVQLMESL